MADGQADTTAPETLDDLAAFLVDNDLTGDPQPKEPAAPKEKTATPDTDDAAPGADDTPGEDADAAPDEDDDAPEDDESEDDDAAAEPTSERKLKVTVKDDDGTDKVLELPEAEVVKGYMRQADYTRGKQELARQSEQAFQSYTQHIEQHSARYMEQTQKQLLAIQALAGLRTPEEMAVLAQQDPGEWVKEQQRERAISAVTAQIEANMRAEQQRMQAQHQQIAQQQFAQAWGVLGQAGIDKPKLKAIFDVMKRDYGIPDERFQNINDPKLVFIMRDAAAYRALQAKKPAVTQKVKEAPKLPPARQAVPRNERLAKRLDARFKGGHAKLDDLAAYIALNKI